MSRWLKSSRLMDRERTLKTGNAPRFSGEATQPAQRREASTQQPRTTLNSNESAPGPTIPLHASSPEPPRKRWTSVFAVRVARIPDDLVDLDATEVVGQLTITGDQFTDRALKHLAGLRILSLSIETTRRVTLACNMWQE